MNWPPRACAIGRAIGAAAWLLALLVGWAFVVAMAAGCGTTTRVTASASCASLMLAIGEAKHLPPERAHADIDSVAAVCRRLETTDAGAP